MQEYVVHVAGVRKAPTVVAEPSSGLEVTDNGDFVLTIEEGTSVTVTPNYETLSGTAIPVDYCDWSLYNGSGYTIQGVEADSYTYTNIQDGDSLEWYAEGGQFSDCAWIIVTVVPKGMLSGGPVDTTIAYGSPAMIGKTPTITGTACTEAVEARDGTYFMTAEEGSSITVTLHYETLSGDKADVEYSWWIYDYATQDYTTTEPLSAASSYTFTNLPAAELDYEWHVSLKGEPNVADSTWITVEIVPKGTLFPEQELTRTEYETGISEVPEALQSIPELNTPAKIEAAISIELTAVAEEMGMDVQPEDKKVYDVSLQYSPDGGDTWVKADETHWPDDGKIKVVLPYPEGTGQFTHTFAVAHMFTKAMNGNVPGTYEYPEVTNTAAGIEFYVTGLSPVALVWEEKPAPVVPATGDNASLALWISLMMLGAAGCVFAGRKMRRS